MILMIITDGKALEACSAITRSDLHISTGELTPGQVYSHDPAAAATATPPLDFDSL
jgi:hypothetical protein